MTERYRLATGGRINRQKPIKFKFNGRRYYGYQGDTVASALLANGISVVGRSFKYHRSRGIVASGAEEPNAVLQIGSGASTLPNQLATQVELCEGLRAASENFWPSVNFDVLATIGWFSRFLPCGFYYKTFMRPRTMWMKYEYFIRKTAGLGISPEQPDPDRYDKVNTHCDVLVVGSGPAGLAAALEAGRTGARVILADEQCELGGSLLSSRELIDGAPAMEWITEALKELGLMEEVRLLPRSTVFGYYDHNFLGILERVTDHLSPSSRKGPRERLWRVRAKQVILAAGAIERPLVFPNNDRPGVMLASAVSTYVNQYAVAPGSRTLVFTNNDSAYQTALDLIDAGIAVAGVLDVRPKPGGALPDRVRRKGIEVIGGHVIVNVQGKKRVNGVEIMRLDNSGDSVEGKVRRIACDLVAVSGGWTPTVHLHSQSGGKARWDHNKACFVPGPSVQPERSVGSCNGRFTLNECLAEGFVAGAEAAHSAGFGNGKFTGRAPATAMIAEEPLLPMWVVPSRAPISREHKQFVDLQEDVSAADIVLAVREGYESIELVKRYTTLAMGTDQGKLSSINGMGILAKTLGKDIPSVGTTKYRPAYTPVSFGALVGRDIGRLFDPVRKTAMHQWHEEAGAKFENVGQWKRPWYYPRRGETMHDTVNRECLATRSSVGILDASTLGKIDVQGPDAAEFLNRVYTNDRIKLAIGRCSYGFMLGEDGMVMDDGVTARFSENHFVLTTTTGGAVRVMAWLERWLQTEWPELKVYLTSVTDHWATLSVAGPNSRRLISELCDDIDFSSEAFPFMSFREGTVAGAPARAFRISFSGELAYEINIPANYARAVWDALMEMGKKYDIIPYGTETMHVLRAEKGYIIAGQDTDGSVTPVDLGMDWIMSKHKDFLGKRSLSRPDSLRKDRKQLVGLLTEKPTRVLPEGGQIVVDPSASIPMEMIGHVTSSYFSACLGRSIALAVVKGGHTRIGQTVHVSRADGRTVRAVIAKPVFYDPEGARQKIEGGSIDSDSVNRSAFKLRRESPLVQFNAAEHSESQNEGIGVHLCERPFLGHLNLRGNPADSAFLQAVERVLGFALPLKPNTVAESRELTALWLGPDEWLLLTPPDREAGIAQALRDSLGNLFFAIVDISSGQTVINIRGNQARDVLAKGCSLDLHPRLFYPGCCAQTHIAKATVLIRQQDHSPSFDLVVRRSFAEYLALWLKDAAQEHGLVVGPPLVRAMVHHAAGLSDAVLHSEDISPSGARGHSTLLGAAADDDRP